MNRKEELIAAATDLNKVLGLNPEIDVSRPLKDIVEDIREAGQLVTEADEISEATKTVMKGLATTAPPPPSAPPAPSEPIGEEAGQEEKPEKKAKKAKKVEEEGSPKSAIKTAVALLQAGNTREEAENEIHKRYLGQGADDAFARKRAKNLVMTATRMVKDGGEA